MSKYFAVAGFLRIQLSLGKILSFFVFLWLPFFLCKKAPILAELKGYAMGTRFSIKYIIEDREFQERESAEFIKNIFIDLQNKTSLYQSDSELIQINKTPAFQWIKVSDDLGKMISYALKLSEETLGYYDITAGSISNIWPTEKLEKISIALPNPNKIAKAKASAGYKNLLIKKNPSGYCIFKKAPGMIIDLASLSAGFGADQISEYFKAHGIRNYLIDTGGEFRASGTNRGNPWIVGIEDPSIPGKPFGRLILNGRSLATSGANKNFVDFNGRHYSHIIDPHTGQPVQNRIISLSVIQNDCMSADALATALIAMGEENAWAFALKNKIPVLLVIDKEHKKIQTRRSPGFDLEK